MWLDESTHLSLVTGVMTRGESTGGRYLERVVTPPGGIHPTFQVALGKESINLWTTFPDVPDLDDAKRALLRQIDPSLVVLFHLAPPLVMGHFVVSMLLLLDAVVLHHRAGLPDDGSWVDVAGPEPRPVGWVLVGCAAVAIFLGTVVTGAGPHAGSHGEQVSEKGGRKAA